MTRPIIDAGTITLTSGSATVTGSGTAFGGDVSGINADATPTEVTSGLLIVPGTAPHVAIVQSAQSDTQLTLTSNWTGSTVSGAAYSIIPLGDVMNISATQQLLRQILKLIEQTQGAFAATDGAPSNADGSDGDFRIDINSPYALYYKEGGTWSTDGDISGPAGLDGVQSLNNSVTNIIKVTQAEHDVLSPPDATTVYFIVG